MTRAAAKPPIPVTWRAHDAAGVGHALRRHNGPGYTRYLCNRMPVAERYAWPVKTKCQWCLLELARLEAG